MGNAHPTSIASVPVFRAFERALTLRAPNDILGMSEGSRYKHIHIVSWASTTSENEGCRAEKIVDDSDFDSGRGKYYNSCFRLPVRVIPDIKGIGPGRL